MNKMTDIELKPCPFCGGKPHILGNCAMVFTVCSVCGARVGTIIKDGRRKNAENDAVKAWNRRAGDD